MKYLTVNAVFSASTWLLWARLGAADPVAAPAPAPTGGGYNTLSYEGCYSEVPNFTSQGSWTYQSTGYCQTQCAPKGFSVMAVTNGADCWCGNVLPANSTKTDTCNTPCQGYPQDMCGGSGSYDIYLTGTTPTVSILGQSVGTSSSTGTTTSTGSASVVTQAGQTIFLTPTSEPQNTAPSSSQPNTAGIAAGVVVGIVGLGAIIGAAVFFIRRHKRKAVEEEYRRNAEINAFVQKKPMSAGSDSRWDGNHMAERRLSNGSIADDEDFSRRILKVTNA